MMGKRTRCGRGFGCFPMRLKPLAGAACMLIGLLVLLICAPGWFTALVFAALLFVLGAWLLFQR